MDHLLNIIKEFKKFRETVNLKHLSRIKLDNACFASDSIGLAKRTIPGKVLKERSYEIARNPKYHGYQRTLASMVYNFFCDKKTRSGASVIEELAEESHKLVIIRVYTRFKDNIWAVNLAEMGSLSSENPKMADTSFQLEFVEFLSLFRYLEKKIIIRKQPYGASLRIFAKFFLALVKRNTADFWLET